MRTTERQTEYTGNTKIYHSRTVLERSKEIYYVTSNHLDGLGKVMAKFNCLAIVFRMMERSMKNVTGQMVSKWLCYGTSTVQPDVFQDLDT